MDGFTRRLTDLLKNFELVRLSFDLKKSLIFFFNLLGFLEGKKSLKCHISQVPVVPHLDPTFKLYVWISSGRFIKSLQMTALIRLIRTLS